MSCPHGKLDGCAVCEEFARLRAELADAKKAARPCTSAMDNVVAWRLGEIAMAAADHPAGDLIDTGLVLRRMLEERGFRLCFTGREFSGSHDRCEALAAKERDE